VVPFSAIHCPLRLRLRSALPSWEILDCLGQMRGLNLIRARQIRNRPREFQHPMEGPCAHAQLIHGTAHQRFAGVVQFAVFADVHRAHTCTARDRLRRSAGVSALQVSPLPSKRASCRSRVTNTRCRTASLDSPARSEASFS
jgi:hypothetical protein